MSFADKEYFFDLWYNKNYNYVWLMIDFPQEGIEMAGDLHTHTTFSDGALPAEVLVRIAKNTQLTHLAISDHDSCKSVDFAYQYQAKEKNLHLIPATELTAFDFEQGRRVHLLCYYPEQSKALKEFCDEMAARRNKVCRQSLEELKQLYPQFDEKMAFDFCQDSGVLYKTHLIRVLYELGYTDGIYKGLYQELFGSKNGKVLHDPTYESVETVLQIIKESNGVAVLAHPSVYQSMELAKKLAQKGLIDGLEIEHPRNTEQDKVQLYALAKEYDLIVTGGSDFHGMHSSRPVVVGQCQTQLEQLKRIEECAQSKCI